MIISADESSKTAAAQVTLTPDDSTGLEDSYEPRTKWAWHKREALIQGLYITYRYHRYRQYHFDVIDKLIKAVTVVLGGTILGQSVRDWTPVVGGLISALGLIALVLGFGDKKQTHKELAEGAMGLIAELEEKGTPEEFTEKDLNVWTAKIARANAKEPPTLKTLAMLCDWEQRQAAIPPEKQTNHPKIGACRRFISPFW